MKASLCMLSAASAVCIAHAAALVQYPIGPAFWRQGRGGVLGNRPSGLDAFQAAPGFPPNWQLGPWRLDRYKPHNEELRRFRAEAEALLAGAGKR